MLPAARPVVGMDGASDNQLSAPVAPRHTGGNVRPANRGGRSRYGCRTNAPRLTPTVPLRQLRRHWRLAASDDAPFASVVNELQGAGASDDPS